nr:hypothetical protein [uncultured Pseudomonas sp.]
MAVMRLGDQLLEMQDLAGFHQAGPLCQCVQGVLEVGGAGVGGLMQGWA